MKYGVWFVSLVLAVWSCLGAPSASPVRAETPDSSSYLRSLGQGIQQGLDSLDAILTHSAQEIGGLGIRNPRVNDLLRLVLVGRPFTISCSVISAGGFMVAVEPAEFSRLGDYNLRAGQDRLQMKDASAPILTRRFFTAEGGWAVVMAQPIKDARGDFLGWLSLLLDPAEMMRVFLAQAPPSGGQAVWLVQGDGVLLYHDQAMEIGRNLLNDPAYVGRPGMAALGRRLQAEAEGELTTDHGAGLLDQTGARIHWISLGLHSAAWRLVLVEPAG